MASDQPTVAITAFPDEVLLDESGPIVPKKVYAQVKFPEGDDADYGDLELFIRIRPLKGSGIRAEMFTEETKGDIHNPRLDDPADNYCMELVSGWAPLTGGRAVPGPGWFEIFDLAQAGVAEDIEVEGVLFHKTGPRLWCSETQISVRQCSHPARLIGRFPVVDVGGLMAIGDLTGNGELDFVVTCGAVRQTAYSSDGKILWDHKDPEATRIHGHNTLVPIYDIDGDGRNEVISLRREGESYYLCILDGETGTVKKRTVAPEIVMAYGGPPLCNIQIANLRGLDRPGDILVSHHLSDITAFDSDLNVLWRKDLWADEGATVELAPPKGGAEARWPYGFGHTPAFADLDGDGHDEVIVGAAMLDHDGRFIWNRKDLPGINSDHNDSICITDIEQDGNISILLSSGLWCLDPAGEVRWGFNRTICHGQSVRTAPIIPGSTRLQILLEDWRCYSALHPPHTFYLLDGDGTVLWHRITGWGAAIWWSAHDHQDIWISSDEMPGIGELLDHEGKFLGYLPGGRHRRALVLPGTGSAALAVTVTRSGQDYIELYESSVSPAEGQCERGTGPVCRMDDRLYSLY